MKKPLKKVKVQKRPGNKPKSKFAKVKQVWYVYAIKCDNASVYIGQTRELVQRWDQHRKGRGARWTRKYKPLQLFYAEECVSYKAARKRERELKKTMGRKFLKNLLEDHDSPTGKTAGKLLKRILGQTWNPEGKKDQRSLKK